MSLHFFKYKGFGIEVDSNDHVRIFDRGAMGNSEEGHKLHLANFGATKRDLQVYEYDTDRCRGLSPNLIKGIQLWAIKGLGMPLEDYLNGLDLELPNEY